MASIKRRRPMGYCLRYGALDSRLSSLDRIDRIVEAGRRVVADDDEAVDQSLVFGGERVVECAYIIVPLIGAGTGDHRAYEGRVQDPGHRELAWDTIARFASLHHVADLAFFK